VCVCVNACVCGLVPDDGEGPSCIPCLEI
jgi:hypothetical protein